MYAGDEERPLGAADGRDPSDNKPLQTGTRAVFHGYSEAPRENADTIVR